MTLTIFNTTNRTRQFGGTMNSRTKRKVRVYSQSAALTAEATSYPTETINAQQPDTLTLDVAKAISSASGLKPQYDWSNKITLQLSPVELPLLVGVLFGYLPNCEFKRPTKGIHIERQTNNIYMRASNKDNQASLPIPIGQTYLLSAIATAQLQLQSQLTGDLLLASIRGACSLYLPAHH